MSTTDGKRGGKRKYNDKKKYFAFKKKKWNQLEPGLIGFLVTCNFDEKRCLMECYDLLNHYAEKLGLASKGSAEEQDFDQGEEEEDFEAAFAKEVEEIKSKADKGKNDKEFQQVVTNAKNVLFIRCKLEAPDIIALMDAILADIKSGTQKGSRHILRMLPVIGTCKVDLDKLNQLVSSCLPPYFAADPTAAVTVPAAENGGDHSKLDQDGIAVVSVAENVVSGLSVGSKEDISAPGDAATLAISGLTDDSEHFDKVTDEAPSSFIRRFNVDFKTRHNGSLDRHSTLRQVSGALQSLNDANKVDYNDPQLTVAIEVVGKTLCLALLKNYKENKKYNLQQLAGPSPPKGGGGGDDRKEAKEEENDEDTTVANRTEEDEGDEEERSGEGPKGKTAARRRNEEEKEKEEERAMQSLVEDPGREGGRERDVDVSPHLCENPRPTSEPSPRQ